ncbi:MAG: hypothetical protein GOU97_03290 [Nanoarchaeota archaeon]|nr:hypothetical protein [Nanoarchaeota archaeon]
MKEKLEEITFTPKKCPKCGEQLVVRHLGVWGYYCIKDMFWWGVIDGHPKIR